MQLCTAGDLLEKALLSCGLRFQRSFTRKAKNTVVTRRKSTDMTISPGLWLGTSWDHVPGSLPALFSIGQGGLLAVCCCEILRTGRSSLHFHVRVQRNGHALADVPFTAVCLLILYDRDTIIAVCHALMTVYHDLTQLGSDSYTYWQKSWRFFGGLIPGSSVRLSFHPGGQAELALASIDRHV